MEDVLRWASLVKENAPVYELSPALVLAVIWIESRGNPDSVNETSGATGLMQVMPYDPERTGEMFAGRPIGAQLLDPRVNIDWGCRILRYYLNREDQSLEKALYRYSGGKTWASWETYQQQYWWPFEKTEKEIEKLLAEADSGDNGSAIARAGSRS